MLSNLGKRIKSIAIISDNSWPSWLYVLDLFLESSKAFKKATVFVSSKQFHNLFGTSRVRSVVWESISFGDSLPSKLSNVIDKSQVQLYSGSLQGLTSLHAWLSPKQISRLNLIAFVVGNVRLRNLKRFPSISWSNLHHSTVGGCSSGKFWLGFTKPSRSSAIEIPTYCSSSIMDILEFAPKNVSVQQASALKSVQRTHELSPSDDIIGAWNCTGLFPHHAILGNVTVIAPTPFVSTKWCSRQLTARELSRVFDVPVNIESRIAKLLPSLLPHSHDLRLSVPGKLLTHALWKSGICVCHEGGVNLQRPMFSTDNITGQLVTQDQFNQVSDKVDVKAAKMDDAEVPVALWNDRLIETYPNKMVIQHLSRTLLDTTLDRIRSFLLRVWMKSIYKSFIKYLRLTWPSLYKSYLNRLSYQKIETNHQFNKDIQAGRECIEYSSKCNWWEWCGGSRLFFWRWPCEFRTSAQDGIPICWLPNKQPNSRKPQPAVHDKVVKEQMKIKLNKVRNRGYVKPGRVKSLIRFFAVPKGNSDIRMVYDGTASGFNNSVFISNFGLPTIETLLRGTDPDSWMVDLDIGDMFLNFMLA